MRTRTQVSPDHLSGASVMTMLKEMGLARDRTAQITAQVNPRLLELARERAGADTDDQLIEIAFGNLVAEDRFAAAFRALRGTVKPDLDLET